MARLGLLARRGIVRSTIREDLLQFGIPVLLSSVYGLQVMSAIIPIVLNRIRIEEKLLLAEFKDAYLDYQKTTKKIIPFV